MPEENIASQLDHIACDLETIAAALREHDEQPEARAKAALLALAHPQNALGAVLVRAGDGRSSKLRRAA